ncbi:EI24 domain-containing protein [Aestuariibius sp. 2305UL40-4]|uniref:EI24 domain-containing protein n=1 Tax=Aestuariibius violaceus TaxID=3234132 RepID=UPI00345E6778
MIFHDFSRALSQMFDPRFRRVLFLGLGLTFVLLLGAYAGLLLLVEWLTGDVVVLPIVGEVTWFGDLLSWGSLLFMIVLSFFLMIPVASIITSMFLDDVASAVEDQFYPHLPTAAGMGFFDGLKETVNFLGVLIAANIGALILCIFFAPFTPFILYGTNGYLLGREYFTLVARRRHSDAEARVFRRQHRMQIWMAGVLMAVPLTIPIMNLFIPILGAATFTHLFHRLVPEPPSATPRASTYG